MRKIKSAQTLRREEIRNEFWRHEIVWTGENEKGWFRAPRTLPLILALLASKHVSGKIDPTRVYLELLARHKDSAVIEMASEGEHSFAAGYTGPRGIRTWHERMAVLEKNGFIKTQGVGNTLYKYVLLMHPAIAVKKLRDARKVPDQWWNSYRAQQIEGKETKFEDLDRQSTPRNVVRIAPSSTARRGLEKKVKQ